MSIMPASPQRVDPPSGPQGIGGRAAGLPRMLTTEQVRTILNVSVNTVYALVAARELEATKVGRDYRYWPHDVELLLERNRVASRVAAS